MAEQQTPEEIKKGRILKNILDAAKQQRKSFIDTGREIERYGFSRDYDFEYSEFDGDLFFKAKVAKTAQYIDVVRPSLIPANPDFRVNPRRSADQVSVERSGLMEQVLNYIPGETNLFDHSSRAVTDAIVYGRGVLWIGWNDRRNMAQAVFDTVDNLFVDPDATMWEDCKLVGRKRCRPRWEWIKEFPAKAKILKTLAETKSRRSDGETTHNWERSDYGTDMVVLYEVWMRCAVERYRGGNSLVGGEGKAEENGTGDENGQVTFSDAPRKYLVTEDGKLIHEGNWEIPFYLDDAWPCEVLDFNHRPGSAWPVSPLESGLGHQRALNWIYTLYLSKARFTTRTLIAMLETNGQSLSEEMAVKALFGGSLEYISIQARGVDNPSLSDYIQQLNFDTGVEEFERLSAIVGKEFEMATGLTEFLMTGGSATQARSAEEVKLKDQKTRQRMDAMRDKTEKFMSKVGRRLAQAERYLANPEHVVAILGQEQAMAWGKILPPVKEQTRQLLAQAESMGLGAGEVEAFIADNLSNEGVVFEDWITEADYTIYAGSMRAQNIDSQLDATEAASNQLLPVLLQQGAIGPAAEIIKAWARPRKLPANVEQAVDAWVITETQKQEMKSAMELDQMRMQMQQMQQQMAMQQQQMAMQAQQMAQGMPPQGMPGDGGAMAPMEGAPAEAPPSPIFQ